MKDAISRAQRLDAYARSIALFALFITPLAALPAVGISTTKVLFVTIPFAIALVLWAIARTFDKTVKVPQTILWIIIAGVLFMSFVSAILSSNAFESLISVGSRGDGFLFILLLALLLFSTTILFGSVSSLVKVVNTLTYSFLVLSIWQLIRIFVGPDKILPSLFGYSPTATLIGSWNDWGVFALIIVIFSLGKLMFIKEKRNKRLLTWIAFAVSFFVMVLVNLSVSWFALFISSLFMFLYFVSVSDFSGLNSKERIKRLSLPLFTTIASILLVFLGGVLSGYISNSLAIRYIDVKPSWSATVDIVKDSYSSGKALFGFGPGNFDQAWSQFRPLQVNATAFWATDFTSATGVIPTYFVTLGVIGGLLLLAMFVYLAFLAFKVLWSKLPNDAVVFVAVSISGATIALSVLFTSYNPGYGMFIISFILFGALVALARNLNVLRTKQISFSEPKDKFNNILLSSGVTIVTLLLVFIVSGQAYAEYNLYKASQAISSANTQIAKDILQNLSSGLTKFFVNQSQVDFLRSRMFLVDLNNVLQDKTIKDKKQKQEKVTKLAQDAIVAIKEAIKYSPNDYRLYIMLGDLYTDLIPLNIDGAYKASIETYDLAQKLTPRSPLAPLKKAQASFISGDLKKAREYATEALKLKANYADAYFLLSQIAIKEKKVKEAIAATQSAAVLSPNNPGVFFQLGVLFYSAKQYPQAADALRRAVLLNPNYANALYYLALADIKLGNKQEAKVALERVLKFNPDSDAVKKLLKSLESDKLPKEDTTPTAEPPVKEPQQKPQTDKNPINEN